MGDELSRKELQESIVLIAAFSSRERKQSNEWKISSIKLVPFLVCFDLHTLFLYYSLIQYEFGHVFVSLRVHCG